jgi:hypothetical protein
MSELGAFNPELSRKFALMVIRELAGSRDAPHYHCVNECEKPQPFKDGDKMYCGKCATEGVRSECVECTPELCGE